MKSFLILFIGTILSSVLFFSSHDTAHATEFDNCVLKGTTVDGLTLPEAKKSCACVDGADAELKNEHCSVGFTAPAGALTSIPDIISGAVSLILIVAGLIAFVYLLLGGIKWITSGGDSAAVEAARGQIIQALIGLIVVFAAWGIIVLFERATGIGLGFTNEISFPTFYKE